MPRLTKTKYGKTEVIQGLSVWHVLHFILTIGMSYYQEGYNIDYLTLSKVLIGHPSEKHERKLCKTNSKILGWLSISLVDQVRQLNLGLGSSDPNRSD